MTPHYAPFRARRAPVLSDPVQDDAALYGKRQADLARDHLAQMTPERRAFLEAEWSEEP